MVVWLGDLGRDLSEPERNYWLSFNVPPDGRKISTTNFKRAILGEFADPSRPDLVFKHELKSFQTHFRGKFGWDLILPLHAHDEHYLTALRCLSKDSQSDFDAQLIALAKILIDSLNESELAKRGAKSNPNDKGITKFENYLRENGVLRFENHIKMLRVLQDLRSKSAAHRKGGNYETLIAELQLADEGQQRTFDRLLTAAAELLAFLRSTLIDPQGLTP